MAVCLLPEVIISHIEIYPYLVSSENTSKTQLSFWSTPIYTLLHHQSWCIIPISAWRWPHVINHSHRHLLCTFLTKNIGNGNISFRCTSAVAVKLHMVLAHWYVLLSTPTVNCKSIIPTQLKWSLFRIWSSLCLSNTVLMFTVILEKLTKKRCSVCEQSNLSNWILKLNVYWVYWLTVIDWISCFYHVS